VTVKRTPDRSPTIGLRRAIALLREPGRVLIELHGLTKSEFYVVPDGGRLSDGTAREILARGDVVTCDPGLFQGTPQSWRLRA
jgi:hypothetical protein